MNRFDALKRWTCAVFIVFTLALAGCEGDDGAPGADGTDGADGADGLSCWDLNGNGVPDLPDEDTNGDGVVDVEDCRGTGGGLPIPQAVEACGLCHSESSVADAVVAHELPPIEAVSNVSFATAGGDLEVTFDLAADGASAEGYDQVQRAYRNNGGTRTDICNAPSRSDPCDPGSLTLTDNGGGNYTITVIGGAAEASNDNRYMFRVGAGDDRETRVYFYGDFANTPAEFAEPLAVSAEACNACHGPEGIGVHGGYFAAEDGGEPCLVCHGSDESDAPGEVVPSLAAVAHGYHSSVESWADPVEPIEPHVTYPSYMNNCSVCHAEEAQLAAVNAMPFSPEGCFSCHGSIEGIPFESETVAAGHADFDETTNCQGCHAEGGFASSYVAVTDAHNGATTERSGVIWDGVDLSVTEGALIEWLITDVADDGTNVTITWQASYNGTGVDPCNATAGEGAPVFFADGEGNLSILRNYAQGEDFILGTNPDGAGQPGSSPGVDDTNTTCAGNVATTVVPVEETEAMYGRVAIQGKPRLPSPDEGLMQVRAKTPTFDWVIGEGGAAPERRAVVDTSLCLQCHVGSLYQHGGNRVDNVDMCLLCHNTAANDQYVRVDNFGGVDASEAYDGRSGQNFGIREMLHAVHSAGETGAPIVIYRGRGIYAWAGSEDLLQNWPTEDDCTRSNGSPGRTVFGSDPETATSDTCQPHNFHTPTYPRGLYDCAACHVEDLEVLPDPTKAMASTVETGDAPFGDQVNDVLEGVTASSCMTCHRSAVGSEEATLKRHAYENGWTPQAFEEGRKTIIEANQ
jgi:OmcA/MtrC family decaheme c-type cytochrome